MLNNRKGLTIIELAVTIVVSGIVIMPIGIIMVYITRSMIETRAQLELHQEVTRGIEFFTESASKCDAYVIYTSETAIHSPRDIFPLPSWTSFQPYGGADPLCCLRIPTDTGHVYHWFYEAGLDDHKGLYYEIRNDNTRPDGTKSFLLTRNLLDQGLLKGVKFRKNLNRAVGIIISVGNENKTYTVEGWGLARNIVNNVPPTIN